MKLKKLGKIPEPHEIATAKIFRRDGFDIHFLAPNRTAKVRTADVKVSGVILEMKSPTGDSKRTFDRIINRLKNGKGVLMGVERLKLVNKKAKSLTSKNNIIQ